MVMKGSTILHKHLISYTSNLEEHISSRYWMCFHNKGVFPIEILISCLIFFKKFKKSPTHVGS